MDPVEAHGRKSNDRSANGNERGDRSNGDHSHEQHDHEDHADTHEAGHGSTFGNGGQQAGSSAAESRASRRRRRKGKHYDGDGSDGPGTPEDSAWPIDAQAASAPAAFDRAGAAAVAATAGNNAPSAETAPIDLKAHAEDPDAASIGEPLVDTGRPRKRRRAASRPAGPAGPANAPQSAAEAP